MLVCFCWQLELLLYMTINYLERKKRRKRRYWVKPWLEKRYERSAYNGIFAEMRLHNQEDFRKYLRMNTDLA